MAQTTPQDEGHSEQCGDCKCETVHDVTVQILTESDDSENAHYSREPYRVAVCRACGTETRRRMNNA